jgi:hypothetical protein
MGSEDRRSVAALYGHILAKDVIRKPPSNDILTNTLLAEVYDADACLMRWVLHLLRHPRQVKLQLLVV